ncbi:hypothetical protein [Pseudomonas sp. R76]|uniref:hypothetical protein n=1 Tax=Pseudomonas sp. R76 TaxID=1573711 RepID=UPI00131F783A|nr:hypothetical protein [Pseudomonas sp. R76]QHD06044.1 hypothetical protein PspR76_09940 [Pseudomonas sp. R76]
MMLLRTLVLERNGQDTPVNGALLCGFTIAQTDSNFLVYSLDEETEPGNSRVYIAALRKKLDRYFLSGVESKEDLQVAMQVFKQILTTAAAGGTKATTDIEAGVPFHFIDLKGCKLPPARPEDHHSMIIKKALVMKVITLGMSAPSLPAIESASLIVPSIRFSSQMVSPAARASNQPKLVEVPALEPVVEEALNPAIAITQPAQVSEVPQVPQAAQTVEFNAPPAQARFEPEEPAPSKRPAPMEHAAMLEVDSTLTSLAKVAQELTQQKLAVIEREEALEQWQAGLQQAQEELDQKLGELEQRDTQLQRQRVEVSQKSRELEQREAQLLSQQADVGEKTEQLTLAMSHLSTMRQRLQGVLLELDQTLDGHA